MKGSVD